VKTAAPPVVLKLAEAMNVTADSLAKRLLFDNKMVRVWETLLTEGKARTVSREVAGFGDLPEYTRPSLIELDLRPSEIFDDTTIRLMQLRTWGVDERRWDVDGGYKIIPDQERGCAALFAFIVIRLDQAWRGGLLGRREKRTATRAEATAFIDKIYPTPELRRNDAQFEVGELKDALLLVAQHFDWQAEHLLASPLVVQKSDKRRNSDERVKATLLAKAVQQIFGVSVWEIIVTLADVAIESEKSFSPSDIRNWARL
jgi:hypothetical protein